MKNRAMTLIETLAALALLGLLAAASFGWITASQRSLAETASSTTWSRAASATLTLLADDIASVDAASDTSVRLEPASSRLWSEDAKPIESITMDSRTAGIGACHIEYRFDKSSGRLTRTAGEHERLLLARIESFEITMHSSTIEPDGPPVALLIRLVPVSGLPAQRAVPLGSREVSP